MKILVTGGAGFVGSHLVNKIISEGYEVYVLDSFIQYIKPPVDPLYVYNVNYRFNHLLKKANIIRGNITNKDDLRRKIYMIKPSFIIHFAALPLANLAIEYSEEAFKSIVVGTVNLLEIIRDTDYLEKFIYISSSMVYGDFEKFPVLEESKKEPKEIYGGMKLAGEYMLKVYSQRYQFPFAIIRPSAIYGPTDNNKRVVSIFLTNAILNKEIEVKNADTTMLDFTYVDDVVDGIFKVSLLKSATNKIFNITRSNGRSLQELVQVISNLYPKVKILYRKGDSFRPNRGTLDIEKAKKIVGYDPKIDLEEGLPKYSEFLENAIRSING